MTSAARPTFLPAMGGYSLRDTKAGPITLKSAKDLNAHTKMKFRRRGNLDCCIYLKIRLHSSSESIFYAELLYRLRETNKRPKYTG